MKILTTKKAPQPAGPYSQGVASRNLLFLSGQLPVNPLDNEVLDAGISQQTEFVCYNIGALLQAAGMTLANTVKTTCFLTNPNDYQAFNIAYEMFFTHKPARSVAFVSSLPKGALVEIEVIAELPVLPQ
jgi:2-iminobutanoate/2-iminopropanoate deaminase